MTPTRAHTPQRAAGEWSGGPPAAVVIEVPATRTERAATWQTDTSHVRSPAVVVDGYVRSSPPTSWCSYPAALARNHIAHWAAGRGWRVGCIFEDDPSKHLSTARTLLGDALERVESRQSDGLIVARLKHLGLSLAEAVAALERISAAGGRFVSILDGIDLGTPTGRLILRLLLSLHNDGEPAA